jgi:hypothetical protein
LERVRAVLVVHRLASEGARNIVDTAGLKKMSGDDDGSNCLIIEYKMWPRYNVMDWRLDVESIKG